MLLKRILGFEQGKVLQLRILNEKRSGHLYQEVLDGMVENVKMGPFTATSGVKLPYYLNLATNFMDKQLSVKILDLFALNIFDLFGDLIEEKKLQIVVGVEVAGGILVSQLCTLRNSPLPMDFIYMRKHKKTTGTAQMLEGLQKYTSRSPSSPEIGALWIDDCMSTGESLKEGVAKLKDEFNIKILGAIFLVDRTSDRTNLEKQPLENSSLDGIRIRGLYDLSQVDVLVKQRKKDSTEEE